MGIDHFKKQMHQEGFYIFPEFINIDLVKRMIDDLEKSYAHCRKIQIKNGVANTEGTAHHLIDHGESFMECLAQYERLNDYLEEYFKGKYILNSFGGNLLSAGMSYANNIHRDIRSFSESLPLMLNTLVMLDDFTPENGATWLMKRGHEWPVKPTEEEFMDWAFQIIGKAGTIVVWNSNMWHRAGANKTDKPRRSVTPEFTKPYIKQGFDNPRMLGYDYGHAYSLYLQQVLGYNSRIPVTLDDWYRPEKDRLYKENQG